MTTTHRIATGIVVTLTLATAAPASATPWDPNSRDPVIPIRPAPEPAMVAPAPSHAGRGAVVVRLTSERSGFDWGDAGIGAAGGTAVALLGVGGALVISERRAERTYPARCARSLADTCFRASTNTPAPALSVPVCADASTRRSKC